MLAKARLPELEQSRAAVLNTLASAQSRRGHQYAIERFNEWYFGILTLAESSAQIGHQILDENLPYRSPLESSGPQQVFGALLRDGGYSAT
jgi:hypothetical protein